MLSCSSVRVARAWLLALMALSVLPALPVQAEDTDEEWDAILLLEPTPKKRGPKYVRHAKHRKGGGGKRINPRIWHAPSAEDFALHAGHPFPPLVVHVVGQTEPYIMVPQSDEGGFDDAAHAIAREAFGAWEGGPSMHPRVLDLIYRATRNFNAPSIHLISGLRNDRKASRHSHGMAADIVLPGVGNEELAAFFHAQGFTGVGTYPRSGFVHIDVREASYFWVDRSPPNKRWKVRQVRAAESKAADEEAIARGEAPTVNPDGLVNALQKRAVRRRPKKKRRAPASKARRSRRGATPEEESPPPSPEAGPSPEAE